MYYDLEFLRLQFRNLIRRYDCDLAYTPMIMSNSFIRSSKARDIEFTSHEHDRPLIVQFAANKPEEFATAAQFVRNYSDGVELNCGKLITQSEYLDLCNIINSIN